MKMELDELWERDSDTSSLNPILDPLAIKINMIISDGNEVVGELYIKVKSKVIKSSSSLRSIGIIFFRHQYILMVLSKIIVVVNFIGEFSTSKVDIL